MKKILLIGMVMAIFISCGNKKNEKKIGGNLVEYTKYLDSLKVENNLKLTMGGEKVTVVGKSIKVGDKIKEVPLTINSKLEDKNIFEEKVVKVIYTAPSLDTKVCSIQTKILDATAKKYPNIKFYSVTMDTPFAQERFCLANDIDGLKAVSDYKYHQFGLQNGFYMKENGLLARALMILDENNKVKYIDYVKEQGNEADVDKMIKFLEGKIVKK